MKHRRDPELPMDLIGCGVVLLLAALCWAAVIGFFFFIKSFF
jgi:hypothetical protein